MSNYAKIYWLTRLDSLHSLFCGMIVLGSVSIFAIILYKFMSTDFDEFYSGQNLKDRKDNRASVTSKIKWFVFILILGSIGSAFLPTQKEAVLIVAGGKTIDFVQGDTSIQKIPGQATTLISTFFDKQIQELKKK